MESDQAAGGGRTYKAKMCMSLLNTGWTVTMSAEELPAGSMETISAGSEGASRLRHSKQAAWADSPSILLKLGRLAAAKAAQRCAAWAHPATNSTLAQRMASAFSPP